MKRIIYLIFVIVVAVFTQMSMVGDKVTNKEVMSPSPGDLIQGMRIYDGDTTVVNFKVDSLLDSITVKTITLSDTLHIGDASLIDGSGYLDIYHVDLSVNNGSIYSAQELSAGDTVRINQAKLINKSPSSAVQFIAPLNGAGNIFFDGTDVEITQNNLTFGNGASVTNPSSGILALNSTVLAVTGDSTDVNGVLNFESLKNQSGFKLYNSHADTTYFEETAFKFKGNLKVTGLFSLTNGTTTTFTQAPNRLTISGGDSLSIRNMTNINPFRATSPQTSTFIGMGAGKVGCTGASNVVMGYQAGAALMSGDDNILIGANAGGSTASQIRSVYIGTKAGYGANNMIAIGYEAGQRASGTNNVVVGYRSGYNASFSGTNNIFFGRESGFATTTGKQNAFLGTMSARANTTASYGVAVGDSAGYKNTTGSNNIFLGYKSGGNNTTGQRNIFLGDYLGYTSADSMLYIDNTGKDSTATPLISGNMGSGVLTRKVTVNGLLEYKIPFAKFERTTNFVASAPDVWVNVPIPVVSGSNNTKHFTRIFSPDTCIVIGKKMILNITATLKTYCGINTDHTTAFRIVKGQIGSTRVSSKCGQDIIKETKAIGDLDKRLLTSDMGFDVGDTLYVQMKTTNVGVILQEFSGFDNPNSATLNLKYVTDY